MALRMFDTTTWSDPWFEDLSSPAKLLFIYLFTNEACNQAGMYRLNPKIMELQSGINGTHFPELKDKVVYFPEEKIIWVKNFFRRQCQNPTFCKAAIKAIGHLPDHHKALFCEYNAKLFKSHRINIPYKYPLDTLLTGQVRSGQYSTVKQPPVPSEKEIDDLANELKPDWRNVFSFVNRMRNAKMHHSAIFQALLQVSLHRPEKPWPYAKKIVEVESQNFYEQDHTQESEQYKEKR